ncbi:peptidase S15 [Rubrobacter xylanophilus DSM 9941]|uniref:Peptidase S15 n=1 Tax=Rubrobacter xylanophilus (strain DSM 9941 / JCM 11954 / NBRC 16129 / PRD-1) TaxID=266117 RepID=Q1ATG7_RUBXD|nr:CocE/NonD family hydrolase [Rubrobacter xylanophilus]ABG05311.1 peptidase S15 [Rubrobacter xylanophilus DSM 9941]
MLPGVALERDVPARMRDGTVLYADVYRPSSGGPFSVILMRLPYDKTQAQSLTYRHPAWYAARGYMVVVQDTRGRWRSEGEFYPFAHEAEDGYDTAAWAASLPRSNGRVGMYGFSYVGATQLQAALGRLPGLRTICPALTGSQYYEGWAYNGGAFALAFNASWATMLAMDDARRAGDGPATRRLNAAFLGAPGFYGHLPLSEYPPLKGSGYGGYFFDWLAHPSYDGYWRRWSVDEDYSRIAVPALHVGGWYDVFVGGTVRNFEGLRRSAGSAEARSAQKLLVCPWYHLPWTPLTGAADFGKEARNVVDGWQLRWFDQFLRDEDTGVLDAPATVFVMGENRWEDYGAWPPEGTEPRDYHLRSGGAANSRYGDGRLDEEPPGEEPPDVYTYDPLVPVASAGGHSCCFPVVAPMGPADQAAVEVLNGVLVYTSAPLQRDLTVLGEVTLTLHAATSAPDTDFTAKLCDVSPDGRSTNVQEGIVRARYRDSLSGPRPVPPGEVREYRLSLGPTAHTFRAGHSLRLQISSSDFPQWDRNLNTGGPPGRESAAEARVATQVVLHDRAHPSRLTLPVAPS